MALHRWYTDGKIWKIMDSADMVRLFFLPNTGKCFSDLESQNNSGRFLHRNNWKTDFVISASFKIE